MIVVHGTWRDGLLTVWAERIADDQIPQSRLPVDLAALRPRKHPFACDVAVLADALGLDGGSTATVTIGLPTTSIGPQVSPEYRVQTRRSKVRLYPWKVPALVLDAPTAVQFLRSLELGMSSPRDVEVHIGDSLRFFSAVVNFGLGLVANGRFLPALVEAGDDWEARWRPIITSEEAPRLEQISAAMPSICRSSWNDFRSDEQGTPSVVRNLVELVVDTTCRNASPALGKRRGRASNSFEKWLDALTSDDAGVIDLDENLDKLALEIDEWRAQALSASREVRTCLRIVPPPIEEQADEEQSRGSQLWRLELLLQSVRDPSLLVDAGLVWSGDADLLSEGERSAEEVLLRDLGRVARLYPAIERLLEFAQPDALDLTTAEAAAFLHDVAPVLGRAGFGVLLPSWWGTKRARFNAKLKTKSKSKKSSGTASGLLGLDGLVAYEWEVALGDDKMSVRELERLVALKQPLVQVRGQWVDLNEHDLAAALAVARGKGNDDMTAGDALRIGLGLQDAGIGLPVTDIKADGWLGDLLNADDHRVEEAKNPPGFKATLRPYQLRGLGWLQFHDRLGMGACLADDMGLGKTAQLLALVSAERKRKPPTLVVCPMSLVGNWQREAERFAPKLRVHVHHGAKRITGDQFVDACSQSDLVLTTYHLAARDQKLLQRVDWHRIVLDEAQNIKNAEATQTKAIRGIRTKHRIALTGTPVENRLSELWSIMEFLNPGLLGSTTAFRKQFAIPIESEHDDEAAARLKRITGPFVLRRLKTDRSIISDLPEKLEIKTYCNLTREQASLYQAVVDDMMKQVDESEGMQRRGLILATMLKLKQVCNHPAQFHSDGSRLSGRSGKLERLEEIIDEVIADGERVLVFTQFAEMGTMLQTHLQHRFGADVAWLHGGVSKKKRDTMVEQFQNGEGPSVFLLSLKAGGTGLTLTAANHVVHFDRWWNPAVENQATDRAFRIGQHRNVQVRKFVTVGTLEERIDQMIEQKKALADRIVGSGENWITELSTSALRDVIALGADAVGGE